MKGSKYLNKWRDRRSPWVGRFNIGKVSVLPKLIYRFNAILMKTLGRIVILFWGGLLFFYQVAYLKQIEDQGTKVTKTILGKKNKVGEVILSDFKKLKTSDKNSVVLIKDRHRINAIEERFKKQIKIANQLLTKLQTQFNGQRIVFSMDGAQTIGCPYVKNLTSIYTFHLM